jgi:hypothetical protein
MHIVQAYPDGAGPWWITEGIADFVRFDDGIDNAEQIGSCQNITKSRNTQILIVLQRAFCIGSIYI